MKHKLIVFCILTVNLLGCQSKAIIKDKDVQTIELKCIIDNKPISNLISDQDTIRQIISKLNHAKREPSVFKAVFILRIVYRNAEDQLILCNGSHMKIDGITYKLTQQINEICYISQNAR